MMMHFKTLTIYQKINYFILGFIGISLVAILIGGLIDLTQLSILHTWNEKSESKAMFLFWVFLVVYFLIIMPNTFTIYVHEMRKQMNPPIPQWYNKAKNGFIILLIALVLVPILIYPFLLSKQPGDAAFITKYFIEKRHSSIKSGNTDTFFATTIVILLCIPFIGIFNWFHAMSWKGFVWLRGKK